MMSSPSREKLERAGEEDSKGEEEGRGEEEEASTIITHLIVPRAL